jgi:hypothetical protein
MNRPRPTAGYAELDPCTRAIYCRALAALTDARIPFLVGGAYAFARYTGIVRHTKDFDVFLHRRDVVRALDTLARAGYQTELTFSHWLGKAYEGEDFIDVIFSSGNGVAEVDDTWFEYSIEDEVLGLPVLLCPAEEMLWSKAFVMERERFDGADVAHILRARASGLDWPRLLRRFQDHWRVLLSHLILFGFVYPAERTLIPAEVMQELLGRLRDELDTASPCDRLCQGTLLSRAQYLDDLEREGYLDARRLPRGKMTDEAIARWTAAIEEPRAASEPHDGR